MSKQSEVKVSFLQMVSKKFDEVKVSVRKNWNKYYGQAKGWVKGKALKLAAWVNNLPFMKEEEKPVVVSAAVRTQKKAKRQQQKAARRNNR